MPVALVQERGTQPKFDIEQFRIAWYGRELRYSDVKAEQVEIASTIRETKQGFDQGTIITSIVKSLGIAAAKPGVDSPDERREAVETYMLSELGALRREVATVSDAVLGADSRLHHPTGFEAPDEQSIAGRLRIAIKTAGPIVAALEAGADIPDQVIERTWQQLAKASSDHFRVFTRLHGYPPAGMRESSQLISRLGRFRPKKDD